MFVAIDKGERKGMEIRTLSDVWRRRLNFYVLVTFDKRCVPFVEFELLLFVYCRRRQSYTQQFIMIFKFMLKIVVKQIGLMFELYVQIL